MGARVRAHTVIIIKYGIFIVAAHSPHFTPITISASPRELLRQRRRRRQGVWCRDGDRAHSGGNKRWSLFALPLPTHTGGPVPVHACMCSGIVRRPCRAIAHAWVAHRASASQIRVCGMAGWWRQRTADRGSAAIRLGCCRTNWPQSLGCSVRASARTRRHCMRNNSKNRSRKEPANVRMATGAWLMCARRRPICVRTHARSHAHTQTPTGDGNFERAKMRAIEHVGKRDEAKQ